MGRISMFCSMENYVLSYKSAYYKVITVFGKLIQYSVIQFFRCCYHSLYIEYIIYIFIYIYII